MANWKGPLRRGVKTAGEVGSALLGMYGTAKGLYAMGGEIYGGLRTAYTGLQAMGAVAPLAIAAV